MFTLLLSAVLATGNTALVAPSLPVTVDFGARGKVAVPRPAPQADFEAQLRQVLMSPRRDAAAVQFCWDIPKYAFCRVILARPGQPMLTLKNSDVRKLLWTPDGKYLVGTGANTVRLWNLVGGVRVHVPGLEPDQLDERIVTRDITQLWLEQGKLCVAMVSDVFRTSGGPALRQLTSTTRYQLPALRPLQVVGLPAGGTGEAPCSMPHAESQTPLS
ncbi:MAG: hypothetical protein Q4C89_01020 [Deinococcus sp.]|uniref:hypothetical protein n=1 Tax=Deinococcus sp. TaxID=47478 RepID=UPI0026DC466E|nr:hypothetical protein [Deinococcus sp.]MDO4244590.1 hypothetical protein [Deinococcus sp.]